MKRNAKELTNLLIKKERSRVNKLEGLCPLSYFHKDKNLRVNHEPLQENSYPYRSLGGVLAGLD
jgi:hypothetical protein